MSLQRIGIRWLASVVLGTVAPLVLAQMGPASASHGHRRDNPAVQDCRKEADAQKLPVGEGRRQFMHQCLASRADGSGAAKGAAARAKMGDPQSGHLRSDPPPAPPGS